LFAVEGEDSDDDGEGSVRNDRMKQGEHDQEGWDDGHDDGLQANGDRQGLLGNTNARRSWVDLSDAGENAVQNGGGTDRPGRGSLSAKAGIILVRSIQNILFYFGQFTHVSSYPTVYTPPRVYTTSSWSFHSSS